MNKFLSLAGGIALSVSAALATPAPLFLNEGLLDEPIVIDATVFVNTGTINIGSEVFFFGNVLSPGFVFTGNGANNPVIAYETQNTLVYTNRGSIAAVPGINFQYVDDAGNRSMASSFYNGPGANINGLFGNFTDDMGPWPNALQPLYGGFVSVYATNIVNRGTIQGFYAGDIQIHGVNVDLSNSRVGSTALNFSSFRTDRYRPNSPEFTRSPAVGLTETDFYPETDVQDIWWRYSEVGINLETLASFDDFGNLIVETPLFRVYTRVVNSPDDTGGPYVSMTLANPLAFVSKEQPTETNQQFEVVFVNNSDPNVQVDVSWQSGPDPVNAPAKTAYVRFTTISPDLISRTPGTGATQFVIVDNYGSEPNEVLLLNNATFNSQKPTNIFAFRAFAPRYVPEIPIGSTLTNADFYDGMFTTWVDDVFPDGVTMTNLVTTNRYATWSAEMMRYPSTLPAGTDDSVTNLAGRVMISGDNLKLQNTRIQGQSLVSLKTDNLVSSRGAVIDAPILNLDLGATNGNLVVQDLAKGSPSRFGGQFAVWATTFTNFWSVTGTNITGGGTPIDLDGDPTTVEGCDTDGDGVMDTQGECAEPTETVTTTNYNAIYHVTVILNFLDSGVGIFLNDLRVHATNVDLLDSIFVAGKFSGEVTNLTVTGALSLFGTTNLLDANLPGLETLNVVGSVSAPSLIALGQTTANGLKGITNLGSISATAINLKAETIQNTGVMTASGGNVQINADSFINDGGTLNAAYDVIINADNANLSGFRGQAGGFFNLNVPGNLTDGGVDFPGSVQATYGMLLAVKPATGDLLGTAVSIHAPQYSFSDSFWAAEDRGATLAGFQNNAALGALSLDVDAGGVVSFSPVDAVNGLYVERLEMSDAFYADIENSLVVYEGMTLYYQTTSDNVDPASLDGFVTSGGGVLRWVKGGDGEHSVPLVTVHLGDGRTVRVPRELRESLTLDSDGDGISNGLDNSPFDLVVVSHVSLIKTTPPFFRIEWMASPGQTYQVQATDDIQSGEWTAVQTVKNSSGAVQRMNIDDVVAPESTGRSYRVVVSP
ncbi:MAG: hypothetical protein JNL10_10825 [Verrucomicrobiales bacterium]|nr:hypothetical protein [Verrucomicrobiales bacterium]